MTSLSPFHWRRRVGMRDVDAWGVVWYGNYLAFCDEARAEVFRSFGLEPGSFQTWGFIAPVVELAVRYHHPARFDEEIDVAVTLLPSRGARLPFAFQIKRTADDVLLAEITATQVLMRTNGDLVYLIPDEFRSVITRIRLAQQDASAA